MKFLIAIVLYRIERKLTPLLKTNLSVFVVPMFPVSESLIMLPRLLSGLLNLGLNCEDRPPSGAGDRASPPFCPPRGHRRSCAFCIPVDHLGTGSGLWGI